MDKIDVFAASFISALVLLCIGLLIVSIRHGEVLESACKAKGGVPYSDSRGASHICLKADAVIK